MGPYLKHLTLKGIDRIISHYNPNKFGEINYAELIYGLKGNMNIKRQSLIDDLFNMLDSEQRGEIEINKFIGSYRNKNDVGNFKKAI
jgi:Ca2+-binding EF-hand superfamily protein